MDGYEQYNILPKNPLEVCIPFAHRLIKTPEFGVLRNYKQEFDAVAEMNYALKAFELIKDYRVITNLAFVLPNDLSPNHKKEVTIGRLDLETGFTGELAGARTLKIGKFIGDHSVRAVCLAFDNSHIQYRATLGPSGHEGVLPINKPIEKDEQLYVPVFAIDQIHEPL